MKPTDNYVSFTVPELRALFHAAEDLLMERRAMGTDDEGDSLFLQSASDKIGSALEKIGDL